MLYRNVFDLAVQQLDTSQCNMLRNMAQLAVDEVSAEGQSLQVYLGCHACHHAQKILYRRLHACSHDQEMLYRNVFDLAVKQLDASQCNMLRNMAQLAVDELLAEGKRNLGSMWASRAHEAEASEKQAESPRLILEFKKGNFNIIAATPAWCEFTGRLQPGTGPGLGPSCLCATVGCLQSC